MVFRESKTMSKVQFRAGPHSFSIRNQGGTYSSPILYRPFDKRFRWTYHTDKSKGFHWMPLYTRLCATCWLGQTVGLDHHVRQVAEGIFNHALACPTTIIADKALATVAT